ncbi:MAG: hypothetical protein ACJAW7_001444 [Candidatus Azotimanducaceae bacterium]|jgi:hypothetical protein
MRCFNGKADSHIHVILSVLIAASFKIHAYAGRVCDNEHCRYIGLPNIFIHSAGFILQKSVLQNSIHAAEDHHKLYAIGNPPEKHPAITLSVKNAQGAVLLEKRIEFARQ